MHFMQVIATLKIKFLAYCMNIINECKIKPHKINIFIRLFSFSALMYNQKMSVNIK